PFTIWNTSSLHHETSRLGSAKPQDRFEWRLIGCLGFERGAQQPVAFEALHQFVRVNDRGGDFAEDIRVALHLRVQVARDVGKIVESEREFLRDEEQIGIETAERRLVVGRRQIKMLIDVRRKQKAAELAVDLEYLRC